MKRFAAALFVSICLVTPAFAACSHNGISYAAGAQLCFGGWLQECTVASYWKAIGTCYRPDAARLQLPVAARPGEFDIKSLLTPVPATK